MQIQTIDYAPEGTKFHKNAFNDAVKKSIRINLPNGKTTVGVIKRVDIVQEGGAVELTIEIKDRHKALFPQDSRK